ncbi:hypothetical protein MTR67_006463 [Solanum verrucosum]|uniref:DUF4408 domain-containing protein n=1 Tax=Solanum verrucosum TaxID=315347 RepID=A0AAF0PXW2_SOLVR|nr:hypothetical protein MTR67_006463 [Solanum verrucosum]
MESLNFHNIKLEKANAKLRYKKRQRVTMFIVFCIFFTIISRFSIQLPLSTDYVKGFGVTLISPRFVFVLVNIIVIILFFKSGHSSAADNVKFDEYKQKYSMNNEACCEKQTILVEEANCEQRILVEETNCEQSKKQRKLAERRLEKRIHHSHSENFLCLSHDEKKTRKVIMRSATVGCLKNIDTDSVKPTTSYPEANCEQSILVEETNCEQSIVAERRLEKRIHRSHSENSLRLAHDEKKTRKRMMRSATVGCLKNIGTDSVKPAMTTTTSDGLSSVEFRKTVEAFIARQQRLLKEEEFSIST